MISAISSSPIQFFKPPTGAAQEKQSPALKLAAQPKNDPAGPGELSEGEKKQVEQLKKTDREVRAHEQAHKNAGGQFAGSATFGYVVGPDGRRYAVSGEVPIDIAPVEGDPQATIAKMNAVAAAALAPAEPSGQDRKIAAQAAAIRAEAQAELAREFQKKLSGNEDEAREGGNEISQIASSAYEAGKSSNSDENISGNIIDLFS